MLRTHPVFEERLGQIEVVGYISKEWNIFTYCSNMFKIHQNTTGQHVIFLVVLIEHTEGLLLNFDRSLASGKCLGPAGGASCPECWREGHSG